MSWYASLAVDELVPKFLTVRHAETLAFVVAHPRLRTLPLDSRVALGAQIEGQAGAPQLAWRR